jgi:hypothetical protein
VNRGKAVKLTRWLSCCLAMAALVVLAIWLTPWQARLLARNWQARWATVPDEEATNLAERIAALGSDGIGALVAGMGSERESVVAAARHELRREVDRWERLPADEASAKLAILIESLAAQSEQFSPPARATAAALAVRVLRWPTDGAVVERDRLVADCTRVLRASGGPPSNRVARQGPRRLRTSQRRGPVQLVSYEEPSNPTAPHDTDQVSHQLPSELIEVQPLERALADDAAALAEDGPPRRLAPDPAAGRLAPDAKPVTTDDESPAQEAESIVVTTGADE